MQKRRNSNSSRSIIAPTKAISLFEGQWKCLAKEAWSNHHFEFFGENASFFNFTIGRDMRVGGNISSLQVADWVIETPNEDCLGCLRLQMINGDFKAGYLLFNTPTQIDATVKTLLTQLITSLFILQKLDTLMLIPANEASARAAFEITKSHSKTILTFGQGTSPYSVKLNPVFLEKDIWLTSESGSKALSHLSWLKKRVEREAKMSNPEVKPRRLSWLSAILSLGFRRHRSSPSIHPLDSFRRNNR
jgi:hypothetical protein